MKNILSVEAIAMLSIAVVLDLLSALCVLIDLAFIFLPIGLGSFLAKGVYLLGLATVGTWQFFRGGKNSFQKFFKKQWKKMGVKFIPWIGDALPLWTIMVYIELKKS